VTAGSAWGSVRPMTAADLDRVMEIETLCFPMPWSRAGFEAELSKPYGRPVVFDEAEAGSGVSGYCVCWRVEDEVHIANLAVHPERRKRGIAERLLRHCLDAEADAAWAGLEVRMSNSAARALYLKLGFRPTAVRKEYYVDSREDALVMTKIMGRTAGGPSAGARSGGV
jgi:[ribosomal protein S18]-alanine N-acetyltransferase